MTSTLPVGQGAEPLAVEHPDPGPQGSATWVGRGALVGVLAGAAGIRLANIGALGFNSDEAVYAGQAASLAGNPLYVDNFPVFRAHPMLTQSLLSAVFRTGEHDTAGRVVVAFLGVATVLVVFALGRRMYSTGVGLVAALFLALMPYHVVVTRQVLLDGPMVLLSTLTLYCLARYAQSHSLWWFSATGAMLGLTMLGKESSLILAGAVYAFLALTPSVPRQIRGAMLALPLMAAVFLVHPTSMSLAGHSSTGKSYLVYQLMRRPNHEWWFYGDVVPPAVGWLLLGVAVGGLVVLRRSNGWREVLLLCWILVPAAFFTVWPVKGFQYLLPVAPAVAVLAARGALGLGHVASVLLARALPPARARWASPTILAGALVAAVGVSLAVPSLAAATSAGSQSFLAGSGGVAGGRELGRWLDSRTPRGSVVMTLGPSMANIVRYYGHRDAYGLSVSPNPLHRNPSYDPIPNPDKFLRDGEIQYIVWDRFSAQRSPHFSDRLEELARRFHGRVVHTEYVRGTDAEGRPASVPVIIVYEVRP
jgi:4-amino-4-deoxy-L-arabinose transferase-like glycosyltransferase